MRSSLQSREWTTVHIFGLVSGLFCLLPRHDVAQRDLDRLHFLQNITLANVPMASCQVAANEQLGANASAASRLPSGPVSGPEHPGMFPRLLLLPVTWASLPVSRVLTSVLRRKQMSAVVSGSLFREGTDPAENKTEIPSPVVPTSWRRTQAVDVVSSEEFLTQNQHKD
nr:uncharacterized protein LOC105885972 isoform X2 [Microcebus murinus]